MPSLVVAIDPENRTGQDAQRVAGNLDRVGQSAKSMSVSSIAAATSLLDIGRAAERLSDGKVSISDLTFSITQATQAVVLLNRVFGLSALGSIGVVAGVAATAFAAIGASTGIASRGVRDFSDSLEDASAGLDTARFLGDVEGQKDAIEDVRNSVRALIQETIKAGDDSVRISANLRKQIGLPAVPGKTGLNELQEAYNGLFNRLEGFTGPKLSFGSDEVLRQIDEQIQLVSRQKVIQGEILLGNEEQIVAKEKLVNLTRVEAEALAIVAELASKGELRPGALEDITASLELLEQNARLRQLSDDLSFAIVDPIERAILAGGEFEDVLGNISQAIQAAFLRNVIANPIAESLSASFFGLFGGFNLFGQHGLAIQGGAVTGLSHGGLLTQPTYMGAGVVARESGQDEFVMPAQRDSNGNLGVTASSDPGTRAELAQQTALLRQLVAMASGGGGSSFGYSARQSGRRF